MKKILVVIVSLIPLLALAEADFEVKNLSKYGEIFAVAASEGILKARSDAACIMKIDSRNHNEVAKKRECLVETEEQISTFIETPELTDYITSVVNLQKQYKLK